MFRYRKSIQKYRSAPKTEGCPFCDTTGQGKIISQTADVYVIKNKFSYDLWEFRSVIDHLMIIPTRHVEKLQDLNQHEQKAVMDLIAQYEAKGYNIYARAVGSVQRTVPLHQHTHAIKTDNKQARGALFWRMPYYLFKI
jgi:diadenosine tetraphosphate (Ap4A) HIT family hydrolase